MKKEKKVKVEGNKLIAIIRIRGQIHVRQQIKDTMNNMKLFKKNYCILLQSKPDLFGMVKAVQDYTTFGEIDEETLVELLKQRGRLAGNKPLTEEFLKKSIGLGFEAFAKALISGEKSINDVQGMKTFFRLTPPRGGFERAGIKKHFSCGGVLGYRREAINDLIRRML